MGFKVILNGFLITSNLKRILNEFLIFEILIFRNPGICFENPGYCFENIEKMQQMI